MFCSVELNSFMHAHNTHHSHQFLDLNIHDATSHVTFILLSLHNNNNKKSKQFDKRPHRRPKDPCPFVNRPQACLGMPGHAHVCTPTKLPLPLGNMDPYVIRGYMGPSEPNGISIGSAIFAVFISVTYTRHAICSNMPHYTSIVISKFHWHCQHRLRP